MCNGFEVVAIHIKCEALQSVKDYLNSLMNSGDIDTLVIDLFIYYAVVEFCVTPTNVNIIKDKFRKQGWIYECQD